MEPHGIKLDYKILQDQYKRGMAVFLQATGFKLFKSISAYMNETFKPIFLKHGSTETEINIINQNIDDNGWAKLAVLEQESEILDFESNIKNILKHWLEMIEGHPHQQNNLNIGGQILQQIIENASSFIIEMQEFLLRQKRGIENAECERKCKEGPRVVNLTSYNICSSVLDQLKKGLGSVPRTNERRKVTIERIEIETKKTAFKYFHNINKFSPPWEIMKLGFNDFIKQLLILSPATAKENTFFYNLRENFDKAIRTVDDYVDKNANFDNTEAFKNLPSDVIISCADKNVATVLVPVQWYIEEYGRQQVKGGFENINLSEKSCIGNLNFAIEKFKEFCSPEQKSILKGVWPKRPKKQKIGLLKLVPKLHKLKGAIGENSWKELTGRPIRGAELCPTNGASIALCRMLQTMLKNLKERYKALAPGSILSRLEFPILKGCDDYSRMAQNIKLMTANFSNTYIITADFSDAYTLSLRGRLQESINVLGQALDYSYEHIAVMIGLVNLVFDNVFFYTIYGLQRSTKGFPMGGHASRDALDIDLVRSEIELLACLVLDSSRILIYGRMVDDVSVVLQGSHDDMTRVLIRMATTYPNMPLNVQISQIYGKFLDMNIYNFLKVEDDEYNLTTTLAWKPLNTYNYIGEDDNKFDGYKGAVMPTSLNRIYRRCNRHDERQHHDQFITRILKTRNQSSKRLANKRENFFMKIKGQGKEKNIGRTEMMTFAVTFDDVTNSHTISRRLLEKSANSKFQTVHKSKPNIGSRLCPKRKVLQTIKQYYENDK